MASSPACNASGVRGQVKIFGTTEASTCEESMHCGVMEFNDLEAVDCHSVAGLDFRRIGIIIPIITRKAKTAEASGAFKNYRIPTTPVKECLLPWEQRFGIRSSRYARYTLDGVTLGGFKKDDCGMKSVGITYNPTGRNWIPPLIISDWSWTADAEHKAKYFLRPWYGHWENNEHNCAEGSFCDSAYHVWLRDLDGSLGAGGGAVIWPV